MKEIRIAILGMGFMGKAHAYGYGNLNLYYNNLPYKAVLHTVYTREPSKADGLKEMYGFRHATSDYESLFNNPEIDVIDICTPNALHKDAILRAIRAGKHIYCEKPMVISPGEAQEVEAALKRNDYKATAQMVFHNRYYPTSLRARQIIDEGRIGRVLSFRAAYLHPGSSVGSRPATWRFLPELTGAGTLFDAGSHVLDLLYSLLGDRFQSVLAAQQIAFDKRPSMDGTRMVDVTVDDATYMIVRLKGGACGMVEASKIATGTSDELRFEIHGEKGALAYNSMSPNYLRFYDATGTDAYQQLGADRGWKEIECVQHYLSPGGSFPHPRSSIGWLRGHAHSAYVFLDNVYNGRPGTPSLHEGAYIQRLLDKVAQSAKNGTWVDF